MRPPTKLLIAARQMLGQSQADLAAATGLNSRTVYKLEHGNGNVESVESLVTYFGTQGITFGPPDADHGWAIFNRNLVETFDDERKKNRADRKALQSEQSPAKMPGRADKK